MIDWKYIVDGKYAGPPIVTPVKPHVYLTSRDFGIINEITDAMEAVNYDLNKIKYDDDTVMGSILPGMMTSLEKMYMTPEEEAIRIATYLDGEAYHMISWCDEKVFDGTWAEGTLDI